MHESHSIPFERIFIGGLSQVRGMNASGDGMNSLISSLCHNPLAFPFQFGPHLHVSAMKPER